MNEAVGCSIEYLSGSTDIYTNAVDAISQGSGVCQDFAHILIGLARHYNYPARYANGFSAHESNGVSETHAWVEIYIEDLGWVAFDTSKKQRLHFGLHVNSAASFCAPELRACQPFAGQQLELSRTNQYLILGL